MSYKPNEYKAIGHYAEQHNAVPQLSVQRTIRFKDRASGEISEVNLDRLLLDFNNHRKQLSREKARARKEEKR